MRALVVEDEHNKLAAVLDVLVKAGVNRELIDVARDSDSARRHLREVQYSLMVLDVVLPRRIENTPFASEGVQLLDEVLAGSPYLAPMHIVGLSAYGDAVSQMSDRFARHVFTLLEYDVTSDAWSRRLAARVRHALLLDSQATVAGGAYGAHLAIVCALEVPELEHVLNIPWDWKQITFPDDHAIYYSGRFSKDGIIRTAYVGAVGRMGMPSAAVFASKLINAVRPEYLAMAGIAAAVPGKANLGDVLVADPSWDWGAGKWAVQQRQSVFLQAPRQLALDAELRGKFRRLAMDHAECDRIREAWHGKRPESVLRVHVGPLASGAPVLADEETLARVVAQHRDVRGIDMEAYSVFEAAAEANRPRPLAFALKSVVDFANGDKNDEFQHYGAYTSAQMLRRFAESYL